MRPAIRGRRRRRTIVASPFDRLIDAIIKLANLPANKLFAYFATWHSLLHRLSRLEIAVSKVVIVSHSRVFAVFGIVGVKTKKAQQIVNSSIERIARRVARIVFTVATYEQQPLSIPSLRMAIKLEDLLRD